MKWKCNKSTTTTKGNDKNANTLILFSLVGQIFYLENKIPSPKESCFSNDFWKHLSWQAWSFMQLVPALERQRLVELCEFDLSSRSVTGSQLKTQMNKQQQKPTAPWLKRSQAHFFTPLFFQLRKITKPHSKKSLVCSLFCDHRSFIEQILCKNFCLYNEIHPQYTTVA